MNVVPPVEGVRKVWDRKPLLVWNKPERARKSSQAHKDGPSFKEMLDMAIQAIKRAEEAQNAPEGA